MGYRCPVFNRNGDVWSQNKGSILSRKEYTSFEGYKEDTGKLHKMAEQVLFTILNEVVKYDRFKSYYNRVSL